MNPLKKLAVILAAITFVASASSAVAASATSEAAHKVAAAKAVEAPAVAIKMVQDADKDAKTDTAVAVVTAGLRKHPAALSSILSGVLKASPDSTEAVVNAAMDVMPDASITIVRVASAAVPAKSALILTAASKKAPAKRAVMEREMASLRGHRTVAASTPGPAGAALSGGTVTQTGGGGTPPVQVNAYAGADPGRP